MKARFMPGMPSWRKQRGALVRCVRCSAAVCSRRENPTCMNWLNRQANKSVYCTVQYRQVGQTIRDRSQTVLMVLHVVKLEFMVQAVERARQRQKEEEKARFKLLPVSSPAPSSKIEDLYDCPAADTEAAKVRNPRAVAKSTDLLQITRTLTAWIPAIRGRPETKSVWAGDSRCCTPCIYTKPNNGRIRCLRKPFLAPCAAIHLRWPS